MVIFYIFALQRTKKGFEWLFVYLDIQPLGRQIDYKSQFIS